MNTLEYFKGDELAADVFLNKYALRDAQGSLLETLPAQMHRRMAKEFARIEANYPHPMREDEIYYMLSDWTVIPQGSPMSAIGNSYQVQSLSNCFVIDSPLDSYAGILHTDQEQVQIMKRRGGVGFDLSKIRPKGKPAANAARTTDGVGVFMERFSNTCREVAQGGRRGALMLTMSVHHPEILTFINIKRDRTKVTGANISVRVSDEFMQAVKDGKDYAQRFDGQETLVPARIVWAQIISAMRDCSEPGLLFWDTIKTESPADCYPEFQTLSTNPCGEIPLSAYDSCRLMLINLTKFVDKPFTPEATFLYTKFASVVRRSQRLMDDLVDLELEAVDKILVKIDSDPEPEHIKSVERDLWLKIKHVAKQGRRTGLGLTGLGDLFAYLGMGYGSEQSIKLVDRVYSCLAVSAYRESITLASERGFFPAWDPKKELDNPYLERVLHEYSYSPRRNISLLTTAPAGSTSLLSRTSSGCEPVLFLSATRRRKVESGGDYTDAMGDKWQTYEVKHPGQTLWDKITGGMETSPYIGSTVEDIDPMQKIKIQAAAQRWIDHSISNTTNLPGNVTESTVADLAMEAWESKCKGLTVYRIGSRDGVIKKNEFPKRPREVPCNIHRSGKYTILVGILNDQPYEVFAGSFPEDKGLVTGVIVKENKHYHLNGETWDIEGPCTRMISLALRHGVPIQYLVQQLRKDDFFSLSSIVARVLAKNYISDNTRVGGRCSNCNGLNLVYQQGCVECKDCGNSKCA